MQFTNKEVCGCITLFFYAQENIQDSIHLDNVLLHFFLPTKKNLLQVNNYGLVIVSVIQHMLIIHNICFMEKQTDLFNALHLLH